MGSWKRGWVMCDMNTDFESTAQLAEQIKQNAWNPHLPLTQRCGCQICCKLETGRNRKWQIVAGLCKPGGFRLGYEADCHLWQAKRLPCEGDLAKASALKQRVVHLASPRSQVHAKHGPPKIFRVNAVVSQPHFVLQERPDYGHHLQRHI